MSKLKPTHRVAPGVGGASIQYQANKFHKDMLRDVKSRVGNQFNDISWHKHKSDLSQFKKEHGMHELRQIDKKNLQMFIRLSSVQPSVPVVVKRNIMQQVDLQPIMDDDTVLNEGQDPVSTIASPLPISKNTVVSTDTNAGAALPDKNIHQLDSERQMNKTVDKRSISVPPREKFNISLNAAAQPLSSPRNNFRLNKDAQGSDGATLVSSQKDVTMKSGSQNLAVQSMSNLPSSIETQQQQSYPSNSSVFNQGYASTRTLRTTTQWYLKAPAKNAFYDQAYKVVPTLNHGARVTKLDQITKENQKFFQRLQGVQSDYNATKMLQKTNKHQIHKKRIASYQQNGRPKRDPLLDQHRVQETLSRKRLTTFNSLNRTRQAIADDSLDSESPIRRNVRINSLGDKRELAKSRHNNINSYDDSEDYNNSKKNQRVYNQTNLAMSKTVTSKLVYKDSQRLPDIKMQQQKNKNKKNNAYQLNSAHDDSLDSSREQILAMEPAIEIKLDKQQHMTSKTFPKVNDDTNKEMAGDAKNIIIQPASPNSEPKGQISTNNLAGRQLTTSQMTLQGESQMNLQQDDESYVLAKGLNEDLVSIGVKEKGGEAQKPSHGKYEKVLRSRQADKNNTSHEQIARKAYESQQPSRHNAAVPLTARDPSDVQVSARHRSKQTKEEIVPILKKKTDSPSNTARLATNMQRINSDSELPDVLNKNLAVYKTSQAQKRAWIDPQAMRIGRSVRIADRRIQASEPPSTGVDRQKQLYQAINLKESKTGDMNRHQSSSDTRTTDQQSVFNQKNMISVNSQATARANNSTSSKMLYATSHTRIIEEYDFSAVGGNQSSGANQEAGEQKMPASSRSNTTLTQQQMDRRQKRLSQKSDLIQQASARHKRQNASDMINRQVNSNTKSVNSSGSRTSLQQTPKFNGVSASGTPVTQAYGLDATRGGGIGGSGSNLLLKKPMYVRNPTTSKAEKNNENQPNSAVVVRKKQS